ncbi:hypothetical protein [Deinococcus koreensis]|uniref:Uncharacterized protein n=1 Tax=Deinococcus koreensis TaxID=2054903 RepID=A0A2K3UX97_9DEIO|nr:hypothetical protein [Deinococcus koreensis]PNY81156.1 hypothetical protein CVO96_06980 [Deinococcus koreensis]
MTSVEYGRHVRRVLEWDEVVAEPEEAPARAPVDFSHGSVFLVDDEPVPAQPSLLASVARLLGRKVS